MIPLGPVTNAGAAADAFDILMLGIVVGLVGIAAIVDVAAAWGWLRRKP